MDVQPPHQPVRGWKDFALHLLTITIGLFIALSLEAAVQSLHHRHLVRDARRQEGGSTSSQLELELGWVR